jgi:hypothetical protein
MENKDKIILHLCADTGSDTKPYRDAGYTVILVGKDMGVENYGKGRVYEPPQEVYGIIANPVCLEFSTARSTGRARNPEKGMEIVRECQRIIEECNPKFWVIENPATGRLKDFLGKPVMTYEPWHYGSPWTKKTALWGKFNIPPKLYSKWENVPKIPELYIRPGRTKPSLAFLHKSARQYISEFWELAIPYNDMEFRSTCSQKFAKAFFYENQ